VSEQSPFRIELDLYDATAAVGAVVALLGGMWVHPGVALLVVGLGIVGTVLYLARKQAATQKTKGKPADKVESI
jgi:hypothetical protein